MHEYQTVDGSVAWWAKATHGIPLDIVLTIMESNGLVPTWDRLFSSARSDGANLERLTRELCGYVRDIYPREFSDGIISGLNDGKQYAQAE